MDTIAMSPNGRDVTQWEWLEIILLRLPHKRPSAFYKDREDPGLVALGGPKKGEEAPRVVEEDHDSASYFREPDRIDPVENVMRHIAEYRGE
jgi:hypothetical protein